MRVSRRYVTLVSALVLALVASLLVYVAVRSQGETIDKADLNDGGVWVTNASVSKFARLNKPIKQLDLGVVTGTPADSGMDVYQDGSAVMGQLQADLSLAPINPVLGTIDANSSIQLPAANRVSGSEYWQPATFDLRGGSMALIEPATGKLHVQRYDDHQPITTLDGLQAQAKPVATIGANSAVAVGIDGTVYAVSGEKGTVTTVKQDGNGFAKPSTVSIGLTTSAPQITAVGTTWVVYDPVARKVYAAGLSKPADVSPGSEAPPGTPAYAVLQVPGPAADTVAVQGRAQLGRIPIAESSASSAGGVTMEQILGTSGAASDKMVISPPVVLGACVHAAWAGAGRDYYGRNCGEKDDIPVSTLLTSTSTRVAGVRLRTNRGVLVLNDLDSGDIWDVDQQRSVKIDNWAALIPPPQASDKNQQKDPNQVDDATVKQPPKAQPDNEQVRPGRVSVLHVIDNDSDTQGSILAIVPGSVTQPSNPNVRASVSADGQTVEVTVPPESEGDSFSFKYSISNGGTAKATATVNVKVVGSEVETPPKLRAGQAKLASAQYAAVPGAAVTVPVVADYRDAENDPLQLTSDSSEAGVDAAGALTVRAAVKPGPMGVKYRVEDGQGGSTAGMTTIRVLSDKDAPVKPVTNPDVIRGVVGKPVQIRPTGNDVAGADPVEPEATLELAAAVRGPGALTTDTDLASGTVTFTGKAPGTWVVSYAAQTGGATAPGRIRVDIVANPGAEAPPVAAPDTATVRDQSASVTDVLGNDYSPRGDVVVLQRASTKVGWLQASIVQGRYIRVVATAPYAGKDATGVVDYTISDGTKTAVGQLIVTQKAKPATPVKPTLVDDAIVVRQGDAVTIPVFDNDSMSEGVPLKLEPGMVKVLTGGGQAFSSGTVVRYVPPDTKATTNRTAVIEYAAYPEGDRASAQTARITVTITPPPSASNVNQAPVARSFTASVTAGDTIALTVPTSGVDPDGDLTFVSEIAGKDSGAVDLKLGRVVGFNSATIKYEAYPTSSGTEVLHYTLRDKFGASSSAYIRIGVVQPGDPQPPVAVTDEIVAAPGRTVTFNPIDNDLISAGDAVDLEPLDKINDPTVLADFTKQPDGTFKAVVPKQSDPAKVLEYGITDYLFEPSRAKVTVRGQEDFINPPVAVDDVAQVKPNETSVLVDATTNDYDIDGPASALSIKEVLGEGAVIEGRKIRVTLTKTPRVVPYVIEDADGAIAMGLIYVPGNDANLPYVVASKTIKMPANSTASVNLADYITDPAGKRITMTSPATLSSSPPAFLGAGPGADASTVALTSKGGYSGPAALMLQVTNATGPDDKNAQATYVSVPVQIGALTPVLRCPAYTIELYADGPAKRLDIPRLCHEWLPDGLAADDVSYTATWDQQVNRVGLSQAGAGGRTVSLLAEPAAVKGDTGTIRIGVKGAAQTFPITVRILGSPPPLTVRPASIDGLVTGTSRNLDMRAFMSSPLSNPQCSILSAKVTAGPGVTVTSSGCVLTVSASDQAKKSAQVSVVLSDAPGREATGAVAITIHGKPDAPVGISAVADRVQGNQARVTFSPPAYNGGLPVLDYQVVDSTGAVSQKCAGSPCTITGLTNGTKYRFKVAARNGVGLSDYSPLSNEAMPDQKPEATTVGALKPGDRTLTVSWTPPTNEGTPVDIYKVRYVNIGANAGQGGSIDVKGGKTSVVLSGLINNDQYVVDIAAHNGAGWGPYGAKVKGQSVGTPGAVGSTTASANPPNVGQASAQVRVTWTAADPNGPPMKAYTIYRSPAGTTTWTTLGSVAGDVYSYTDPNVPLDGSSYQYWVTGTNGGDKEGPKANPSAPYRASGVPDSPTIQSVTTPREDYRAVVVYTLGSPRSTAYASVRWQTGDGRSGTWSCSGGQCTGTTGPLGTGAGNTVTVTACNDAGACTASTPAGPFRAYGPTLGIRNPGESHNNTSVTFTWSPPADNGRPITGYRIRGDLSADLGPGQTSITASGLGYSTTRTITVTPIAQDSGAGPATTISGTTNAAPPPQVVRVYKGALCGAACNVGPDPCTTTCYYVGYELTNYSGAITCYLSSDFGPLGTRPDDGSNGSHRPVNGLNQSNKFFGYSGMTVSVRCVGSNGSDTSSTLW